MSKNAVVIAESSGKSVEYKEAPGIFTCLFEHEVKATKADFRWLGPKFTKEQWNEMLAFFKWTYDTEKSESQVRLFVHPTEGWKIWAFPQKGGTSMTTKEIDNEDSKLQRAAIPEGYIAYGTIHHHCSSPAFQSSVDTADEKAVDGLHITIGRIDEEVFDMHVRLYQKGHRFDVNMGAFWEIGEEAQEKVEWIASLGFNSNDVANKEARLQMCIPPQEGQTFPAIWQTNYILPPPVGMVTTNGVLGTWCYHCQKHGTHSPDQCTEKDKSSGKKRKRHRGHVHNQGTTAWWDEKTIDDLFESAKVRGMTNDQVLEVVDTLGNPESPVAGFYQDVADLCGDNYLQFEALYELVAKLVEKGEQDEATVDDKAGVQKTVPFQNPTTDTTTQKTHEQEMTDEEREFYMGGRIVD